MAVDISLIFPESPFLLNQAVFPPLGILYLSAYLKKSGFKVQCLDLGLEEHKKEMVESGVIGISFSTPQREQAFKLAEYYSSLGKVIIAGGPHATHMRKECEQYFDHVIGGYGEGELFRTLSKLRAGVSDHWYMKNTRGTIDDYPFPDRNALPIKDYKYYIDGELATVIMTSRGCPHDCSFCARIQKGCEIQSAKRTIDEILFVNKKYGYKAFMIFDDIFIASKKRLKTMAEHLGDSFKFRCFARSNLITDEVCEDMVRLGIVEVGIGIESGSLSILRKNMKGTTPETNLRSIQLLKKHGIRAKTFLIIGLPGESEETINETEAWIQEAKPDDLDISVFQPLPGSVIFNYPEDHGINFDYNGIAGWYKGTPGEYKAMASTEFLTAEEIVYHRDRLENKYKNKEMLR